jgi:hypothetical protein
MTFFPALKESVAMCPDIAACWPTLGGAIRWPFPRTASSLTDVRFDCHVIVAGEVPFLAGGRLDGRFAGELFGIRVEGRTVPYLDQCLHGP